MHKFIPRIFFTTCTALTLVSATDNPDNLGHEPVQTESMVSKKNHNRLKKRAMRDPLLTSAPLLSDTKYFEYRGLSASKVSVKSILGFNRPYILHAYNDDPKGIYNFICLMVLVEKSLQGVDVELMSIQERHDMVSALITIFLRKYGYITELDKFLDSHDESYVLPAETLCRIANDIIGAILDEHNHVQPIFNRVVPSP